MTLFVDPDIALAKTLPKEFYLSDEYFEKSREKLFDRTWQFVGDTDQVKDPGWVTPVTYLENFIDESLILTKDKQNKIHCLSNVCTHRGNLIIEKPCKLADIRCKYHGRRFHLDGQFLLMPEFKEVKNFPTPSDNLSALPVFQWGKWLFTSLLASQAPEAYFKEMMDRVNWMPFDKFIFRPDLSKDYLVDAHWALYCENFLEGFHIPFIHAGLNSVIDYGNYTIELFPHASLQIGIAKDGAIAFDLPSTSPDYGKQVASYYFWVFPNMMFNFYPWGLSINLIQPLGISRTKIKFLCYILDESKLRQGAGANLDQVELEDEAVVQNVQKGIRSR
ncbi:MAG TPA: aromatic ring-hydroxylating dioxygenase subunit alpha [Cyclobacteriaceae bacterium]|nr:aromatic ring-hydroxylating dioxygenase subunit alpha [Cyclobacteriaceae bacterium]